MSLRKTIAWKLSMALKLDAINETGKPQKVHGSTYTVTVPPGQRLSFGRDDAPEGY